jgi:hypothetical protein
LTIVTSLTRRFALVLVAVLAALVPASSGGAQERAIPVMVQTVPALTGVGFSVDDDDFSSDATGLALVTVQQPGGYQVSVGDSQVDPDTRFTFVRWGDGIEEPERRVSVSSFTYLQAGFQVSHRVDFRFSDAAGGSLADGIDSFVLTDSAGRDVELSGGSAHWLETNRLIFSPDGLKSRRLTYHIREVVVDGRRIEPVSASGFSPTEESWEVSLPVGLGSNGEDRGQGGEGSGGAGESASMNVLGLVLVAGLLLMAIAVGLPANRRVLKRFLPSATPRFVTLIPHEASHRESISRLRATSRESISRLRATSRESISRLRATSRESISRLRATSRESISRLRATSRESISRLRATSRESISRLRATSRESISRLRATSRESISRLRATCEPILARVAARPRMTTAIVRGRFVRRPPRQVSELVRVRLKDGRTIEGWTDHEVEKDHVAVRLAQIDRVRDQSGRSVGSTPRDAFVLQSQIATLEVLVTSAEGPIVTREEENEEARVIDLRAEDARRE